MKKFNFIRILPVAISILFLVSASILFGFLYFKIGDNEMHSKEMQSTWQTEANRREDLKSLEKSLASIEQERALLDTHFAQSSDVVPFLDMLDQLAKSVNTKASISQVSVAADGSGLFVQMQASGNFASVYKLLTLIENSPYEIQFTSMEIQSTDGADAVTKTGVWSISLGLKLLSFIK